MAALAKLLRWPLFLILAPLFVCLVSYILILTPLIFDHWITNWSLFSFLLVSCLFFTIYRYFFSLIIGFLFLLITQFRPDYWCSSIIIVFFSVFFIFSIGIYFIHIEQIVFGSLKEIIYFVFFTPFLLRLVHFMIIMPFLKIEKAKLFNL